MSKHTPGPWDIGYGSGVTGARAAPSVYWDETDVKEIVIRKGSEVVCYVASSRKDDDLAPDARLIAAAPELLAMLERTRDELEASGGFDGDEPLFSDIVGLIAKATGAAE